MLRNEQNYSTSLGKATYLLVLKSRNETGAYKGHIEIYALIPDELQQEVWSAPFG